MAHEFKCTWQQLSWTPNEQSGNRVNILNSTEEAWRVRCFRSENLLQEKPAWAVKVISFISHSTSRRVVCPPRGAFKGNSSVCEWGEREAVGERRWRLDLLHCRCRRLSEQVGTSPRIRAFTCVCVCVCASHRTATVRQWPTDKLELIAFRGASETPSARGECTSVLHLPA